MFLSTYLKIKEAIEIYEMNIYNENFSESSILEYLKELRAFEAFLEERSITHLDEIRIIDAEMYFAELIKKGNSANTRSRTKSVLNSFFEVLEKRDAIAKNPMDVINTIKVKESELKDNPPLTKLEFKRFKRAMEKHSRMPEKNLAIAHLLGICGLRVGELIQLKWDDLDKSDKSLKVRGKGGKTRYVPVFDDVFNNLLKLQKKQPKGCEYIINYKNENRPVSTRSVFDTVERYAKKANLKETVGCHTLRATSATHFLISGVNVKYIQMLLGHSDITTTSRYLRPMDEEMANALKQAHKSS